MANTTKEAIKEKLDKLEFIKTKKSVFKSYNQQDEGNSCKVYI